VCRCPDELSAAVCSPREGCTHSLKVEKQVMKDSRKYVWPGGSGAFYMDGNGFGLSLKSDDSEYINMNKSSTLAYLSV